MPERKVIVGSTGGLHARPAKMFVEAAARQPVPVSIRTAERGPVPAGSMLSVLSLGAAHGTEVVLQADGEGADAALTALADLLARDLEAHEPPLHEPQAADDARDGAGSGLAHGAAGDPAIAASAAGGAGGGAGGQGGEEPADA